MKKLIICLIVLSSLLTPSFAAEKTLTILHTNDVHGNLLPRDHKGADGFVLTSAGGMAMRATMIREARASTKGPVIYLDAGDIFLGDSHSPFMGVPEFECMSAMGVDAAVLGNHDFQASEGAESQAMLADLIDNAAFPVLCGNVSDPSGRLKPKPYVIIRKDGLRIGVFGVTAKRTEEYPQCAGLVFDDPIETTEKIIGEMRGKYDFLIALTHVSYGVDAVLAIRFPEIDVIVGGDSHTWLRSPRKFTSHKRQYEPEETGGTLCVQDGEFGVCLGRLDMVLTDIGGRYRVKSYSGKLVPVRDVRPDPSINEILRKYIKE